MHVSCGVYRQRMLMNSAMTEMQHQLEELKQGRYVACTRSVLDGGPVQR